MCNLTKSLNKTVNKTILRNYFSPIKPEKVKKYDANSLLVRIWESAYSNKLLEETGTDTVFLADNSFWPSNFTSANLDWDNEQMCKDVCEDYGNKPANKRC